MSGWRQLAVTLDAADAASATALLEAAGAASVTTSAADDEELFVAHAGEVSDEAPLWSRCRVTGLFPEDQDLSVVRQQFAALSAVELHETHLDDDAWQLPAPEISLQFGGDRLRLRPRSAAGGTAEVPTLYLDAGLAFGSGSHPTTRMCLEFLATAPLRGARVLDYGCGSGILALAAFWQILGKLPVRLSPVAIVGGLLIATGCSCQPSSASRATTVGSGVGPVSLSTRWHARSSSSETAGRWQLLTGVIITMGPVSSIGVALRWVIR